MTSDEIKRLEELAERQFSHDVIDQDDIRRVRRELAEEVPDLLALVRSLQAQLDAAQKVVTSLVRLSENPDYRLPVERKNCHCGRKICTRAHYFKIGVNSPIIDDARALLAHSKLKGE